MKNGEKIVMNIQQKGIVFAGGDDRPAMRSSTFPGICILPDGRWLCTFRSAPKKGATTGQKVSFCWSDDEGRSWSEPVHPFPGVAVDGHPGLIRAGYVTALQSGRLLAVLCWVDNSDPEIPFFNNVTEGLIDTRIFLAESEDNGSSWKNLRLLRDFPFSNVPVPITGPVLQLPDGRLVLQFEVNKPYYETQVWHHRSVLLYSDDGGMTWPECDVVSSDPENRVFYWDQRPGVMADGSLLDTFWTYDNGTTAYRNIHTRSSGRGDQLRSWGPMVDSGIPGQPAQPVVLEDGSIALVYVDRTDIPAIRLAVSRDGGVSWISQREPLYLHRQRKKQEYDKHSMNDAWSEMGKFSVGLPAAALCGNGDLLVVFYAGPDTDTTAIKWLRVPEAAMEGVYAR